MSDQRLYFVSYDIGDARRLRAVYRLMKGFGQWVQYSVFQCRLSASEELRMLAELKDAVNVAEDHVLVVDLGPADAVKPCVKVLGKRGFRAVERKPIIV